MKKAFITGITGFAGSYLAENLLNNNYEVSGTYLSDKSALDFPNKDKVALYKLDLLDGDRTSEILTEARPEYLFHLAALTSTKESFDNPTDTVITNITSQINVLEALRKNRLTDTRVLVVSSAEVYGLVDPKNLPVDEETPFNPTNPYAVSKLAQDYLGLQYALAHKLKIVRVRPFNHVGPKQSPDFVVSGFAKRIAEIEKGKQMIMKVGNLTSKRDFTDVVDMMEAYRLALEKGEIGEVYNLGSGNSYEISRILEMLIGFSSVDIQTEADSELMRPSDNPELVCDYSKFGELTGWKPEIPIEKTLKDTLDYWRNII